MRIVLASNVYPPNFIGGAELIAHHQAKILKGLGHEVCVFAGETQPFGKHYELRQDEFEGIPVYRISMLPRDFNPTHVNFSQPTVETHFKTLLESFRPDVFHGHNLIGLSAALPRMAKEAGAVTVVTLHDYWGFCFKNTLLKERERICEAFTRCAECLPTIDDGANRGIPIRMRQDFLAIMLAEADALVSPSRYLAAAYAKAGFSRSRLHVIRNGIDVNRFQRVQRSPSKKDGLRLSFIGALLPHKGVATLAEALGHLPDDAPVRVNLIGSGNQQARCQRILERNRRTAWVRFWGKVDNRRIEEVYAETDVLVLPSIWPENQPVSITEAMACGIPAIVSELGGMPELVEDNVTGKIFRAGDARDLARCIEDCLRDPSLITRFGERARERIERYSFEAQVKRLHELYGSLRSQPPDPEEAARLVVCSGQKFERQCARIMAEFPAAEGWRFVLREWLDEDSARSAWLTWVVDPCFESGDLASEEGSAGPLLVTIRNRSFVEKTAAQNCGLYYDHPAQAIDCIRLLGREHSLRNMLAGGIQ